MDWNINPETAAKDSQTYEGFLDATVGTLPEINPFGDLDNDVHPMFAKQNFRQQVLRDGFTLEEYISTAAYEIISPTLRLASLLITERSMCPVFDHIANGIVTPDKDGNLYLANGPFEDTEFGHEYVQKVFEYLGSNIFFLFSLDLDAECAKSDSQTLVATRQLVKHHQGKISLHPIWLKYWGKLDVTRNICFVQIRITFRHFYLKYFEEDMQQDTPRGQMNALFVFLQVLMHEVTHAFGYAVENYTSYTMSCPEHHWSVDVPFKEYGRAYEAWFFQGRPMRRLAQLGKLVCTGTMFPCDLLILSRHTLRLKNPNTIHPVEGSYNQFFLRANDIRTLYLKSTWNAIRDGRDIHAEFLDASKKCQIRLSVITESAKAHVRVGGKIAATFEWTPQSAFTMSWFFRQFIT